MNPPRKKQRKSRMRDADDKRDNYCSSKKAVLRSLRLDWRPPDTANGTKHRCDLMLGICIKRAYHNMKYLVPEEPVDECQNTGLHGEGSTWAYGNRKPRRHGRTCAVGRRR